MIKGRFLSSKHDITKQLRKCIYLHVSIPNTPLAFNSLFHPCKPAVTRFPLLSFTTDAADNLQEHCTQLFPNPVAHAVSLIVSASSVYTVKSSLVCEAWYKSYLTHESSISPFPVSLSDTRPLSFPIRERSISLKEVPMLYVRISVFFTSSKCACSRN